MSDDLTALLAPLGAGAPLLAWAWVKLGPLVKLLERGVTAAESIAAELPRLAARLDPPAAPAPAELTPAQRAMLHELYDGAPEATRDRAVRAALDDVTEAPDPPPRLRARVVQHTAGR